MAKINKTLVGESLVGEGNEVAHIDLMIGPRGGAVETAFCNTLKPALAQKTPKPLSSPNWLISFITSSSVLSGYKI